MSAKPKDLNAGLKRFETFHKLEPNKVGQFDSSFVMPNEVSVVGQAVFTCYRSNKWTKKSCDYIHDHEAGVKVGRLDEPGKRTALPSWLVEATTLVRLGYSLGFGYTDARGDLVEAEVSKPLPELYCDPSGRALLVIAQRKRLVAVFWGGYLDVTPRGIVG